jgi:hypothetical protein
LSSCLGDSSIRSRTWTLLSLALARKSFAIKNLDGSQILVVAPHWALARLLNVDAVGLFAASDNMLSLVVICNESDTQFVSYFAMPESPYYLPSKSATLPCSISLQKILRILLSCRLLL